MSVYRDLGVSAVNWQAAFPDAGDEAADDGRGAAIFTRRGDYLATGWLSSYQHVE
jgi:hypothetical protein